MADHPEASPASSDPSGGAREELFKRALIRLSIAAENIDPALDQQLTQLREALRGTSAPEQFAKLLPKLERSVLELDDRRQNELERVRSALHKLLNSLQSTLPEDRQPELDSLRKILSDSARHAAPLIDLAARSIELFLAGDHGAASPAAVRPRSLLSRLLRRSPSDTTTEELPEASNPENTDSGDSRSVSGPIIAGEEQSYSQVAAHVESILLNLLDQLQVASHEHGRRDRLRSRLASGLNWYELAALLDDLSLMILSNQNGRQDDFEEYLKQLNQRLAQFQHSLGDTHDAYRQSSNFEQQFEGMLRQQVAGLHADVRDAVDLEALKHTVENKLEQLMEEVDQSRQLRQQHELAVASKLQGMVERIQLMETEAQTFRQHLDDQQRKAMLDNLTGLANRAGLEKRMQEEFERWQRYGGQLLLAVIDVDHFKQINDSFGHLAGDKVLRLIAQQLSRRLRKSDFIGRFGGEEFVALMPGTTPEQGHKVLDEIRQGIENSPFHYKNEPVSVTISIGYSALHRGDSLESVFERSDQAMYQAKQQGRNQVVEGT